MTQKQLIKSPLRYPGGKSRAISYLSEYLPPNFTEYREPFVGGGSFFIYLKQIFPDLKFWINDLNQELYLFWKIAQSDLNNLVNAIYKIKETCQDGKKLFQELTSIQVQNLSELERAVRFFILNRITFSGTVESGGYSQGAYEKRFTYSSIERLAEMGVILNNVKITNLDYSEVINQEGKEVFMFLDPPYFSATQSRLYGKRGTLHLQFDHQIFAQKIQQCDHKWLITYDDTDYIRAKFSQANIQPWELQYGMNNYKQKTASKGKELLITNYLLNYLANEKKQLSFNLSIN
jgi:DNA adenine methylase